MDMSLIFFTVFSQFAAGLALFYPLHRMAGQGLLATAQGDLRRFEKRYYFVVILILGFALGVSALHLGHPFEGYRTLAHLANSWLSREILAFSLFGALLMLAWYAGQPWLMQLSALLGIIAVSVAGMVYAPEAQGGLHNALPLVLFLLTAVASGSAAGVAAFPGNRTWMRVICIIALTNILVLNLVIPSVWASGDIAMRATAAAWLNSSWYWLRIVIGLALPLILLIRDHRAQNKAILPLVLLGEIFGRMAFFQAVHTAQHIGEM